MVHNLTPTEERSTSRTRSTSSRRPAARRPGSTPSTTPWLDVVGGPTRSSTRSAAATAATRKFTYPDEVTPPAPANDWRVPADRALVVQRSATCTRAASRPSSQPSATGSTSPLPLRGQVLRARGRRVVGRRDDRDAARLEGPRPQGRPAPITATYDTGRARGTSRWGSCRSTWPTTAPGRDPFKEKVDWAGKPSHGHLAENDNHGGEERRAGGPARRCPTARSTGEVTVDKFLYTQGDMSLGRRRAAPAGRAARASRCVRQHRGRQALMHSITACKAP